LTQGIVKHNIKALEILKRSTHILDSSGAPMFTDDEIDEAILELEKLKDVELVFVLLKNEPSNCDVCKWKNSGLWSKCLTCIRYRAQGLKDNFEKER
jgi:hypothetical protein